MSIPKDPTARITPDDVEAHGARFHPADDASGGVTQDDTEDVEGHMPARRVVETDQTDDVEAHAIRIHPADDATAGTQDAAEDVEGHVLHKRF
jgi:hypothetical protein